MEDDILIEKFLRNTLSDAEQASFVARMESDVIFKEQVVLEEQLLKQLGETYWSFAHNEKHAKVEAYKKILESAEIKALKETISKAIETYKNKETSMQKSHRSLQWKPILRIAAVLVIFFSAFWYFSNDNEVDYTKMTQNAWNKNIGLDFTLRSHSSDEIKMSLEKALRFYNHTQYDSTLITLKRYDASHKQYKDVLLLRALANYRLDKPEIALTTLDSLSKYTSDISKWYKGLIYLDQKKHKESMLYLEIPSESNQEIKLKK
ncbi:hypothetical protein [Kordia sp.]|uniref:hypothetical protein n=1 Tax=Kordia sp. TaxID=1965332 RepID=UPI003B59CC97